MQELPWEEAISYNLLSSKIGGLMSALNNLGPKAVFGSRKSISGKYSIFRKCYFPERKTFSCVWLSQNSFYGKLISVFGSFKHFYRKCIKFGKRNKTQQKKMNQIRRRRRWDRAVKATASGGEVDDRPTSGARPTSTLVDRAARLTIAPRDLIDRAARLTIAIVNRAARRRGAIVGRAVRSGLSLLSLSLFFRKWFEVKMMVENHFRVKGEKDRKSVV